MTSAILNKIDQQPIGWVFNATDFLSFAKRNTIDQTLSRIAKTNKIIKVATGLYCIPDRHPLIGEIPAKIDDIVQVYAKKHGYQVQVSPAKAANLLGLSQQVPSKYFYITNAPSRKLEVNGIEVNLTHVCPKKLVGVGTKAGLIIQALYSFGKDRVNDETIDKLKNMVDSTDIKNLKTWMDLTPYWMQSVIKEVVADV